MLTLRIAQSNEAGRLAAIGLRAWETAVAGLADVERMRVTAEQSFFFFLRDKHLAVTVAELDGEIAGWAARENYDGTISDLWVDPQFQRRGVATALLAALEADIRQAEIDAVDMLTHAQNAPAIAFFQQRGYRIHWLSTQYSARLDRDVESVGMRRDLVTEREPGEGYGSV